MAQNRRFENAVRIMAVLSRIDQGTSEALAEKLDMNPIVIRRVVLRLSAAGMTLTRKGPGGGIMLARDASKITLAQIHRAVIDHPMTHIRTKVNAPELKRIEDALEAMVEQAEKGRDRRLAGITLASVA